MQQYIQQSLATVCLLHSVKGSDLEHESQDCELWANDIEGSFPSIRIAELCQSVATVPIYGIQWLY